MKISFYIPCCHLCRLGKKSKYSTSSVALLADSFNKTLRMDKRLEKKFDKEMEKVKKKYSNNEEIQMT